MDEIGGPYLQNPTEDNDVALRDFSLPHLWSYVFKNKLTVFVHEGALSLKFVNVSHPPSVQIYSLSSRKATSVTSEHLVQEQWSQSLGPVFLMLEFSGPV